MSTVAATPPIAANAITAVCSARPRPEISNITIDARAVKANAIGSDLTPKPSGTT